MYTVPPAAELFGTTDPLTQATKMEALKAALDQSAIQKAARQAAGSVFNPDEGVWISSPGNAPRAALDTLNKSAAISPALMASLQAELEKAGGVGADLMKDITLTSPLSTGLVPYDLEPSAKLIFPVLTPLRNMIPRVPGKGTARRFKRITGITGSGTGGVANLSPFISDTTTDVFGAATLQRPKKIAYAADEKTYIYKQMGLSDSVAWSAEFAGLGFSDARQFSHTALLYASMQMDEKAILGARGTDSGVYLGTSAVPTIGNVTATVRTAGVGEFGNSAVIANLYWKISSEGIFGESAATASATSTGLSAATGKVVDLTMTGALVPGATGYRIYVSTDNANFFFAGRTAMWGGSAGQATAAFTIGFNGAGTGGTVNAGAIPTAVETASSANAWDGLLTVQLDPAQSGAIYNVNGPLSTSNAGVEFQNLFGALFSGGVAGITGATAGGSGVKANPGTIWMNGMDKKQLSDAVRAGGASNPSFIFTSSVSQAGFNIGGMISGIYNELTASTPDFKVHPWMPQGDALVLSDSIPIPDSGITNPFSYVLVQDYMGIDWPVIQTTYDISSYWFGALVHYAPMFSGAITGIKQV